jgi:hypothetical protein
MASNTGTNQKRSYAVPCASAFRDAVSALAQSRKVNVGDLARSVLLLVTRDVVAKYPNLGVRLRKADGEIDRLKGAVMALAFEPLTNVVRTAAEALHVLGFPLETRPDQKEPRSQYRMLATIHHTDNGFDHHGRMTQLHEALSVLKK